MDLTDIDVDVAEATNLVTVRPTPRTPTVGMKRPRAKLLPITSTPNKCPRKQGGLDCVKCLHLLAENRELRQLNALLTEQLNECRVEATNAIQQSEAPRPGKVPKAIAEKHQVRVICFHNITDSNYGLGKIGF